ncbi:MAG: tetratricopeptide repeat protein [Capsulimonas sp.]|uniref:tetratricopeptide repeat protein n=1 Tax=Capsulimonas sp. TaxID=2494211 RepID=UPI0032639D5A
MKRAAVVAASAAVLGLAGWAWTSLKAQPRAHTVAAAAQREAYDPNRLEQTIRFYEKNIQRDSQDAIGRALLAGLYSQRCRETGDIADATRAEAMARNSLAIRTRSNMAAYNQLAQSLFTQHRFPESLALTQKIVKADPSGASAQSLLVELNTEMGDYKVAAHGMAKLVVNNHDSHTLAMTARLMELTGNLDGALAQIQTARTLADANLEMSADANAWYHMREGNMLGALGRADEAKKAYLAAVAVFPNDYRSMTFLTRLCAGQGNYTEAIQWGTRSAAIVPTPETLALLGDAYGASGDARQAKVQYAMVDAAGRIARAQGGVYDRQRAVYCADHHVHLAEAVQIARHELTIRHDVFAYDTLAWVSYQAGDLRSASAAMAKALAWRTQDAQMQYHAGMIAQALGDRDGARAHLAKALALNPYWNPFAPKQARLALAKLNAPGASAVQFPISTQNPPKLRS